MKHDEEDDWLDKQLREDFAREEEDFLEDKNDLLIHSINVQNKQVDLRCEKCKFQRILMS